MHRKMGDDSWQLSNVNASRKKTSVGLQQKLRPCRLRKRKIATVVFSSIYSNSCSMVTERHILNLNRTKNGCGQVWSRLQKENTTAHHTDRGEMESAREEVNLALVDATSPRRKKALVEFPASDGRMEDGPYPLNMRLQTQGLWKYNC